MKITACPKCGSTNIHQGRMKDGILTGYTYKDVCRDCGYQGMPIIFDSEEEYKKFILHIKVDNAIEKETNHSSKEINVEKPKGYELKDLSEKDKQVIDILNETAEENDEENDLDKPKSPFLKNPFITIGITIIIVGILLTSSASSFLISFTGAFLLVGVIFIVVGLINPIKQDSKKGNRSFSYDKNKSGGRYLSRFSLPTIAGIFLLWGGVISIFTWTSMFSLDVSTLDLSYFPLEEAGMTISDLQNILYNCSIIEMILSVFLILSGVFAIQKKLWVVALLGSILGLFTIGPLLASSAFSFIGLIILIISKKDFN